MQRIIDTAGYVGANVDALVEGGVECVIRYYNHQNSRNLPSKRLSKAEAQELHQAGLSMMTVFQQRGGYPTDGSGVGKIEDFAKGRGDADARRAVELAGKVGQPEGSAIYFGVDWPFFRGSEIDAIKGYFEEVGKVLGKHFTPAAYGSGSVLRPLLDEGLITYSWLAGARGWSGRDALLRSHEWTLFQWPEVRMWPGRGFSFDENVQNPAYPAFGQFNLNGPAGDDRTVPARTLAVVTGRYGVNLRSGPGSQFELKRNLRQGSVIVITGQEGEHYLCDAEADGQIDGYVHSAYVEVLSGGFPIQIEPTRQPTPYEVALAEQKLGVREIAGAKHNPRIVLYHASTQGGAMSDETPWCSSFINYCVEQAGMQGTDTKWAKSWNNWGQDVTSDPAVGDIVVFSRKGMNVDGGHVGFFVGDAGNSVHVLGGNQGDTIRVSSYPKGGKQGPYDYKLLSIRRGAW